MVVHSNMATPSPPKPWERGVATATTSNVELPIPPSNPSSTAALPLTSTSTAPVIPERPASLNSAIPRNANAYPPYSANRVGVNSPYGGISSTYGNPYSRMGYGAMGGMGGVYGMGGMGGMGYGGMGNMYGGMGADPNDPNSLTNGLTQNTQATFQMIENIVGAFGGFAQMLESTYMATHSSFFAMVSVAEQFGNLKNSLGSILGIFTLMRWLRTLFAKLTGRPPPSDAMSLTPRAFARFEGRKSLPDGSPASSARPSKKPLLFFAAAAFGLPYLMAKLIRVLAASQDDEQRRLAAAGQLVSLQIDPSKLEFCRVIYDFTPESGAAVKGVDLEVRKGDLVAVLSKSDPLGNPSDWWRCRARDGQMGYLPGVYLEVAKRPGNPVAQIQNPDPKKELKNPTTKTSILMDESEVGANSMESFQRSQFNS
ncbi:peroxisomal docking factor component Pex13/hypothetical protein [Blumeria hordei DH14]|uniref:Peroxisomal membrane protein PEX13 n=1 Tax=Blumeria graminis f. sp. hordei (strain DH14) TaxID=546991 RepID=N1JIX1_BLUG1|nr:peroxisomal docking factor component Pex13/hypothetical protein [Blumeria hordei DH14]